MRPTLNLNFSAHKIGEKYQFAIENIKVSITCLVTEMQMS